MDVTVGHGSKLVEFEHPEIGTLRIRTGLDRIGWGYSLNIAQWPTYGGEVIQILSCYVENLTVQGTLQTYSDMEAAYTFFFQYMQIATQGDPKRGQKPGETSFNQQPMIFRYPHRGWQLEVMPISAPGFRKSRDLTAPNWQVECHVIDEENDVDKVKELVIKEAELKKFGTGDDNFDLKGRISFEDENPFSDPMASDGQTFDRGKAFESIGDFYSKLLPSYLKGDFDGITGNMGSKPAFSGKAENRALSSVKNDVPAGTQQLVDKAANKGNK